MKAFTPQDQCLGSIADCKMICRSHMPLCATWNGWYPTELWHQAVRWHTMHIWETGQWKANYSGTNCLHMYRPHKWFCMCINKSIPREICSMYMCIELSLLVLNGINGTGNLLLETMLFVWICISAHLHLQICNCPLSATDHTLTTIAMFVSHVW